MKHAILGFCFVLLGLFSFGQTLHKGSFLGFHQMAAGLKPGVTLEQYTQFYTNKMIPEIEKDFPGMKVILLKAVRGEDSSHLGLIFLMDKESDRNKYFTANGGYTPEAGAAYTKVMDKLGKELETYEASSDAPDKFTDWVVQ